MRQAPRMNAGRLSVGEGALRGHPRWQGRGVVVRGLNCSRPGENADPPVHILREDQRRRTGAAEPIVLQPSFTFFIATGGRNGSIENIDSALPQVVQRLAASRICAMTHHRDAPPSKWLSNIEDPGPHAALQGREVEGCGERANSVAVISPAERSIRQKGVQRRLKRRAAPTYGYWGKVKPSDLNNILLSGKCGEVCPKQTAGVKLRRCYTGEKVRQEVASNPGTDLFGNSSRIATNIRLIYIADLMNS